MVVGLDKQKELVLRLKKGERLAFDEFVEFYRNRGFVICYNLVGNAEDAKDALQEAFIKAYLNIKGFRQKSEISTWFYRILVNCSLDFLRRRKRMYKVLAPAMISEESKEPDVADTRFEPSRLLVNEELSRLLDNCIAQYRCQGFNSHTLEILR